MIKTPEQRKARMMDGKPIEEFFNDAAQRQKRDNQYATYDGPAASPAMRDDMTADERKRNDERHERKAAASKPAPLPKYDPSAPKMASQPPDPLRTSSSSVATGKVPEVKYASAQRQPEKSEPKKSGVGDKFAEVRGSLAKQRAAYRRIKAERRNNKPKEQIAVFSESMGPSRAAKGIASMVKSAMGSFRKSQGF